MSMKPVSRGVVLGLVGCLFAFSTGYAQTPSINSYSVHPQLGFSAGFLGEAKSPATLSNSGFGLGVNYRQPLDRLGLLAIRFEFVFGGFGGERRTVVEQEGTFSESQTEVGISHHVMLADIGLHLQFPRSILRPYVSVGGGLSRFGSSVTVTRQVEYGGQAPDSSGMSDNSPHVGGVAGILLMISSRRKPVFLDAGVRVFRANAFDAALISDVNTNNSGFLVIPKRRLPAVSRYMFFIGVSFALH